MTEIRASEHSDNPLLDVNYSDTLHIDRLDGKDSFEVVVPLQDITFMWDKLEGDSYYYLRIVPEAPNKEAITIQNYKMNSYRLSSSNLTPGYLYSVILRRYDSAGDRISSGTRDFKFVVVGAESILLEKKLDIFSPLNNQICPYDDLIITWSNLNFAVSYELFLEYNCGKKHHEIMTVSLDSSTNSYTIPTEVLQRGCPHRVQITAWDRLGNELDVRYNFTVEGDSSTEQIFEPVITAPYIDTIKHQNIIKTIPVYKDVNITWTEVKAAKFYSLELVDLETDTSVSLVNNSTISENQYTIPAEVLSSGHRYSVTVYAHHTDSCYKKSDEGFFRAPYPGDKTLDPPQLITPDLSEEATDPTTMYYQDITFSWKPESAAVRYSVLVVNGFDGTVIFKQADLTTNSVTVPYRTFYEECLTDDIIKLEITARDAEGQWACSQHYITFIDSPIGKTVLVSPVLPTDETASFPAYTDDEDLSITWDVVPEAIKYKVVLREYYKGDWDEVITWENITETTWKIPDDYLYIGGKYQLRISAVNAYGRSKASDRYYFQIGSADYIGACIPTTGATEWMPSYHAAHKYINVNAAGDWSATVSVPWLTIDQTSGNGCMPVKIDVTQNEDEFARTGYITFTNDYGESAIFTVIQAANASSNEGPLTINYPVQGETIEKKAFTVRWSYPYDHAYFNIELKNLITSQIVFTDEIRITPVTSIPNDALRAGNTYLLTVYVYNYAEVCVYQSSVTFKVDESVIAPTVTAVTVTPVSGTLADTYTFTAQATGTDKVAFYVDAYHLGTVTGANGVFTFSHGAFTATGDRTVYAYPCGADGQPIKTEGSYASAAFTIAKAPRLDPVTITSSSYRISQIDNAVDLSWRAPANAPAGTRYNIYVYHDGSQIGTVITTTALSCTIPAGYFLQEGEYLLEVIPVANGWESPSGRAVTISVRTAQPTLKDYALDRAIISLGGSVCLAGFVDGNGGIIAKLTVTILNTDINDGGTIWTNQNLNAPYFDLSTIPALNTAHSAFKGAGNYKIRVFVQMQGADGADMLGNASLSILTDARLPLPTPVVTGSDSAIAGDNYQLSWIPVANADYYELTIDGTSYKEIIKGNAATIPGKTLKNLTGVQSATILKLRLVAHSNDTDTWLSSSAAVKTITVLPEVQSRAMILGVTMNNYTIVAGTAAEFTVTTTTDVTAIRMKDGAGSFIIGTWNTGYVDKNGERVWTITQQINDPGVNNQRVLTFYSMIGDTEYNKCDIGFTCVVTAAIGSFNIISPAHESKQTEHRDLSITWNAPANVAVDSYIVRVYHGDECILQQDVPTQNPAPVVIPGALLLRDNEAYQVRITARKVGHAESTAVSRFTLICPHDNTYQPVETTRYTNTGSASTHSFVKTISYTCADCGQKNVGTKSENGVGSHNWVYLDNGGRVCNFCWYMEGVTADPKKYKFIGGSQNRTVYMNVDAFGEPYGVQKNDAGADRQVFETDVITVLGTKGACYLIRYPVGQSGYHFGFMRKTYLYSGEQPTISAVSDPVKEAVKEAVEEFFASYPEKKYGIWSDEYTVADEVIAIELPDTTDWKAMFLETFRNYFMNAVDIVVWATDKILLKDNGLTSYVYDENISRAMIYRILEKVCTEQSSFEPELQKINDKEAATEEQKAKKARELRDLAQAYSDTITDVKQVKDISEKMAKAIEAADKGLPNADKIAPKILNYVSGLVVALELQFDLKGDLASAIEVFIKYNKKYADLIDKGLIDKDLIDDTLGYGSAIFSSVLNVMSTKYILAETTETTLEALKESILALPEGDSQRNQLCNIIERIEEEYNNKFSANMQAFLAESRPVINEFLDNAVEDGVNAILKHFGKQSVSSTISWVTFASDFLYATSGTAGYLDAVNDTYAVLPLAQVISRHYADYCLKYRDHGFTYSDYYTFYSLHNLMNGVQIVINEIAIDLTNSAYNKDILQKEIEHLKKNALENWKYNPYSVANYLVYPNLSDLNNAYGNTGELYKRILTGYEKLWVTYDGLLGNWENMTSFEKKNVVEQVEKLVEFSKYQVTRMYFIDIGYDRYKQNVREGYVDTNELRVLFVNSNGDGMLIGYIPENNAHNRIAGQNVNNRYSRYHIAISMMKKNEIQAMFNAAPNEVPISYYLLQKVSTTQTILGYGTREYYYIHDEREYLKEYHGSRYYCEHRAVNRYFRYDLYGETYENILNKLTTSEATIISVYDQWEHIIKDCIKGKTFWMDQTFDQFAQYLVGKEAIVEVRKP